MISNRFFAATAAIALLTATSACNDSSDTDTERVEAAQNISESLGDMEGMTTASALIEQAGLKPMLEGDAPYTLFLPSDQAFAELPESKLEWLRSDEGRPELIALLRQHIVPGMVNQQDLEGALKNLGGEVELANVAETPLALRREGEAIVIAGGSDSPKISLPPRIAANGAVYQISAPIQP